MINVAFYTIIMCHSRMESVLERLVQYPVTECYMGRGGGVIKDSE